MIYLFDPNHAFASKRSSQCTGNSYYVVIISSSKAQHVGLPCWRIITPRANLCFLPWPLTSRSQALNPSSGSESCSRITHGMKKCKLGQKWGGLREQKDWEFGVRSSCTAQGTRVCLLWYHSGKECEQAIKRRNARSCARATRPSLPSSSSKSLQGPRTQLTCCSLTYYTFSFLRLESFPTLTSWPTTTHSSRELLGKALLTFPTKERILLPL